jgi:hypothetical protein
MGELDDFKGLSAEQFKKLEKIVSNARNEGKTKNTEDYSDFENSLDSKTASDFGSNFKVGTLGPLQDASTAVQEMVKGLDPTNFQGADYLMKSGQELANAMGIGQARMSEMRTTIADAIPEMLKLGISSDDAFDVLKDVPTALGVNTTMGKEALIEMGAAAKVSGVDVKELAKEFKGVGMSLYDVGDRMAEVATYAKSVGVNVSAVSKSVVENLYKMNLYNFDNGVKGLAKMAANAASMGVTMEHVQTVTDKVFNPEGAIEMAAGLQRLGVSSSALLDPLKAMDLSMNDPEQLQKEIGNIAKEFSSFNKETGKFEIMPGSKRRLMEVAKEMGIPAKELANMSIKASEFDMKMSKIKFPSLAASEEDKTLIANMSQMKNGEAVVQIKNEKTGKMEEVNVSKLTAEQLTKLREQQADKDKSIEDLALDQLNVLQSIDAGINGGKAATTLGKASTPAMDRFYNAVNVVRTESVRAVTKDVTSDKVREGYSAVSGDIEGAGVKVLQGDYAGAALDMTKLGPDLIKIGKEVATGFGSALVEGYGNIKQGVQNVYSPVTGVKPLADDDKSVQLYKDFQGIMGTDFVDKVVKAFNMVTTKNQTDINIKVDGGSTLPNGLSAEQFKTGFEKFISDPTNKSEVQKILASNNVGLLTNP